MIVKESNTFIAKVKANLRAQIKELSIKFFYNELTRKRAMVLANNLLYIQKNTFRKKIKCNYDIFNYNQLLIDTHFKCDEYYKGNYFYGISNSIKTFSGFNDPIKACIEHGVYFGDIVPEIESYNSGLPAIITFSDERKKHIRKVTKKPVFSIGPYISYTKNYCSKEQLESYKNKFGKTLLVFPSHSVDRVRATFNTAEFVEKIKDFKVTYNFDTVIVCLYYRDIEHGRGKLYEENGFVVTTAGRREDPNFLGRLKSLISLSDYTMSNSVGTHVGYSIVLEKPHMIIPQKTIYEADYEPDLEQAPELFYTQSVLDKKEVLDTFTSYSESITEDQRKVCNKFWGIENVRSSDEIQFILDFCEKVYRLSKGKEKRYVDSSYKVKEKNTKYKKILDEAMK
ncbi:hypothetical protein [Exiguobacterium sp. s26]|uniref:hypothetical protein n=1 Tax=Exiguobacterium sp. s26 TaxID=2751231 RepID=UPI001BEC039A|nr:hypothetical protein [Exiguobacterium sp. s26]